MISRLIIAIGLSLSLAWPDEKLKPFVSDYCTYFPEGTPSRPGLWQDCCYNHDLRYWFGGTKNDMYKADQKLRSCVYKKAGSFYANLMYYGVRAGHFSPVKNKRKWGWGWKPGRSYQSLSSEDKIYTSDQLDLLKLDPEFLRKFKLFYGLPTS